MPDSRDLLGHTVVDAVTGFRGVVTGVIFYLTGSDQALVVAPAEAGKPGESTWIDTPRLLVSADVPAILR